MKKEQQPANSWGDSWHSGKNSKKGAEKAGYPDPESGLRRIKGGIYEYRDCRRP